MCCFVVGSIHTFNIFSLSHFFVPLFLCQLPTPLTPLSSPTPPTSLPDALLSPSQIPSCPKFDGVKVLSIIIIIPLLTSPMMTAICS